MPLAATGMGLEIVVLNEVSQVEKDKCCMRSLVCGLSKSGANNLSALNWHHFVHHPGRNTSLLCIPGLLLQGVSHQPQAAGRGVQVT